MHRRLSAKWSGKGIFHVQMIERRIAAMENFMHSKSHDGQKEENME